MDSHGTLELGGRAASDLPGWATDLSVPIVRGPPRGDRIARLTIQHILKMSSRRIGLCGRCNLSTELDAKTEAELAVVGIEVRRFGDSLKSEKPYSLDQRSQARAI